MSPAATALSPASPAWLLLPAGALCGFGLGMLALALWSGALDPDPMAVARPGVRTVAPAVLAAPAPVPARPWPALFGSPALHEPMPEPDDRDEFEPEDAALPEPPALPELRLRGLALDDEGGWALIETPRGVRRFSPGEALDDHFRIGAILADGVVIEGPERETILRFAPAAGAAAPAPRPPLAGVPARPDPGSPDEAAPDRPLGLPPPGGFRMGPGFGGPPDR